MDLLHESLKNKDKNMKPYIFMFKANVQQFKIHYQIKNVLYGNYPHMGVTAREGIHVLYRIEGTKQWFNVDAFTARNSPVTVNMKYLANNQYYEILIYGPALCEVELLKIEIEDNSDAYILNADFSNDVLVVGGIHSLGIGCTSSGVMFSNILGRKFNKRFQNISFNDSNHLKAIYDNIDKYNLQNLDVIILEVDYIWQKDDIFDKYVGKVIKKLKSKCNNLICWYAIPKSKSGKYSKVNNFSKKYSKKRDISFLDLSFIFDEEYYEMCVHSNNYINDAGNIMIFKKLFKEINKQPVESNFNEKLRELKNGIFKFNR